MWAFVELASSLESAHFLIMLSGCFGPSNGATGSFRVNDPQTYLINAYVGPHSSPKAFLNLHIAHHI